VREKKKKGAQHTHSRGKENMMTGYYAQPPVLLLLLLLLLLAR